MEYVIRFAISLFDLAVFMYYFHSNKKNETSIKGMDMGWIYHCCNYMDIYQQHKKSVSESCDSFDCAYTVIILL